LTTGQTISDLARLSSPDRGRPCIRVASVSGIPRRIAQAGPPAWADDGAVEISGASSRRLAPDLRSNRRGRASASRGPVGRLPFVRPPGEKGIRSHICWNVRGDRNSVRPRHERVTRRQNYDKSRRTRGCHALLVVCPRALVPRLLYSVAVLGERRQRETPVFTGVREWS
jgi:hypothetical protein